MMEILWLPTPHHDLLAAPVYARKSVHGYIVAGRKSSQKLGRDVFETEEGARSRARELREALRRVYQRKIEDFA